MISLDNIDQNKQSLLNSPRSLESLKILGLKPKDLQYKALEDFADGVATLEILNLRFENHEKKRKGLIQKAKKERAKIIQVLMFQPQLKPGSFSKTLLQDSKSMQKSQTTKNLKSQFKSQALSQLKNQGILSHAYYERFANSQLTENRIQTDTIKKNLTQL